ncbi:MAG TPA: PASTA domain-containing protein [Gaiellaceae bacterium]|nr:PASTA domain-containing protein [Gaiellaceae bacterium]
MSDRPARWRIALFASLVCLGIVGVLPGAASALVTTAAATNVPYIEVQGTGDNVARTATVIGSTVYVGGTFSKVFETVSRKDFARTNLYAYNEATGQLTSFAPTFNGAVWGLDRSGDGRFLYVAGDFTTVDGVARRGLARFDLTTGRLTSFDAHLAGQARTVNEVGGHLIVGGAFSHVNGVSRVALASLDPTTGALQPYLNAELSGSVTSTAGPTQVLHSAVNSTGTQLAVAGNFTSAAGKAHWRTVLLDLGASSAKVSSWNAPILQQPCRSSESPNYVTGLSFSQDGTWLAMSTDGFKNATGPLSATVCDAVARFGTTAAAHTPTWVNYSGCDSLLSVLVTSDAVYVGGHQRWLDNSACDVAGAGAVARPGIGAISPTTGRALAWNPTRSRGHGADFLGLTARGLLVLSDCAAAGNTSDASSGANFLAGTYHPCVGLLPAPPSAPIIKDTLSVSKAGDGTGTVTSSPAGINCGTTCSFSYTQGSSVALTAEPAKGSSFAGWSGNCTGKTACAVSMLGARSVVASFARDCVVPKLKGKTLRVAKRRLKRNDCRLGKVKHAFSRRVKKGHVISQRPKAHRLRAHGARVRLTVSRGRKR